MIQITIVTKIQQFCNRSIGRLNQRENINMSIYKNKITTQDELNEPAPIDEVEPRVEAEMKELEEKAKRAVRDGLEPETDKTKKAD